MISKHKPSGIYLINKPISWSSFDVVKKIRSFLRKKYNIKKIKVGHCGTLDPLASGLLIVFVGDKTKIISQYQNLDKEYIGTIKLGSVTDSFDRETKEKNHKPYSNLSIGSIKEVIESFLGQQDQMPPIFSAVKINGERLYKHARNGNYNIHLEPRIIKIHKISILSIDLPFLQILIRCSKGTYIRSLAHDIGKKLGCGAYLFNLKRSKIGQHNLVDACTLEEFINNYS